MIHMSGGQVMVTDRVALSCPWRVVMRDDALCGILHWCNARPALSNDGAGLSSPMARLRTASAQRQATTQQC